MLQGHTAVNLSKHVRTELDSFVDGGTKNVRLFTTHDAAANMVKASQLLNSEQFIHCLAHALHLLLVTDGLNKCVEIRTLLEKCNNIVSKLHFKGCELQDQQATIYKDIPALEEVLNKISDAKQVLSLDIEDPVEDQSENTENDLSEAEVKKVRGYTHVTLKKPVVTRWNSALHMLRSIVDNFDALDQVLLRTGLGELRLDDQDKELLEAVRDFLTPFEEYTQLVSSCGSSLSLAVLIRKDLTKQMTAAGNMTLGAIRDLKQNIMQNIDKRFQITHTVLMATLMDPSMKKYVGSLLSDKQLEPFYQHLTSGSGKSTLYVILRIFKIICTQQIGFC